MVAFSSRVVRKHIQLVHEVPFAVLKQKSSRMLRIHLHLFYMCVRLDRLESYYGLPQSCSNRKIFYYQKDVALLKEMAAQRVAVYTREIHFESK